jgi:hypothetical protein
MTTKNESLIHVKMDYGESLETKKDVLGSERDVLRLLQAIKKYHDLRSRELLLKSKIDKKIKELKLNLAKMEQILPKIKIPKILIREGEEEKEEEYSPITYSKAKKEEYDKDLENELREIQEKLRKLE